MRYTTKLAYEHSPFYRNKFKTLGITPDDVQDSDTLTKYIKKGLRLTRNELLSQFDKVITAYASTVPVSEIWSSGSTGAPKRIWYAPDDFKRSYEQVRLAYNAAGLGPGDYVINVFSPPPNASGPMAQRAGLDMGLHMLQMGVPMPADRLINVMKMCKPKGLFAISTRMNQIPGEIAQTGIKASDLNLKVLFTAGEPYSKEKKAIIERDWGGTYVADAWASAEVSIMGYMSENCNSNGLHVTENRLLFDVVDPETLESMPAGKIGVDLITTLYDEGEKPATILIGYSHNDLIKFLDIDRCKCGRTYRMIEWPLVRRDDIIHVAGQNLNVRLGTEATISKYSFLTMEYLAIYKPINEKRTRPVIEIRIEGNGKINDVQEKDKIDMERSIWSGVISNPAAESMVFTQSEATVNIVEKGQLFKGFEQYQKPGKPIRLIKIL